MKRGTELLREKLASEGHGAQARFVARFNGGYEGRKVDAPTVSRWVSGAALPSREHMARIEDTEGITMRAWAEEAKEPAA
jgi:hypothetical protein